MKSIYVKILKIAIALVFLAAIGLTFFMPDTNSKINVLQAQTEAGYGYYFQVVQTTPILLSCCGAQIATRTKYQCVYGPLPTNYKPCSKNIYHYEIQNVAVMCKTSCDYANTINNCKNDRFSCLDCRSSPSTCGIGSGTTIVDTSDPNYVNGIYNSN